MKEQLAKLTGNPIGAVAGGVVGYFAAKKMVEKTWALVAVTALGVVAGAYAQSMLKAKSGAPKAADVKK
jgi:uncharacterized protein YcfJ